ncbi:hypothetical protein BYT27DRAFT_7201729 [Phlegmacium glaucopus]|nr:hypothetical protein BYT27DRAFT_7201729 [Phlegmacium glaucopus]
MAPIEINDPEEFHKAFSSPKPFIIYYYTTWCSGCRRLKFSIQTAADAEEYADLPIYKVDCDSDKLWQVVPEDVIGVSRSSL